MGEALFLLFFLSLAFLQVGLGVSGCGLKAGHSRFNEVAGQDRPPTPSPMAWAPTLLGPAARGTGSASAEPEADFPCRGADDCPLWSLCQEDPGGHKACHCDLGYHLSPALGCVPARTFPARLLPPQDPGPPSTAEKWPRTPRLTTQIQSLFWHILGHLDGYLGTTSRDLKPPQGDKIVLHHFSVRASVTLQWVETSLATFRERCHGGGSTNASHPACPLLLCIGTYQSLDLCQLGLCDPLSTTCSFQDGLTKCTCRPGYFQAQAMDRTCTACGNGFWLQNATCARCPFGFGGAACQESFLLALVIVSCLAGLLLLLLPVAFLWGRAPHSQEQPCPPQLPLNSPAFSLPCVRPPWGRPEEEETDPVGPLALWDGASSTRSMKTFLGGPRTPPSPVAPPPTRGSTNMVFVSDEPLEVGKRGYF